MNKKTSAKKSIWQWLQALFRLLLVSTLNKDRVDRMNPLHVSTSNKDRVDGMNPPHVSASNKDRVDRMNPLHVSTSNKDRVDGMEPPHVSTLNKDRADGMNPPHVSTSNKDRVDRMDPPHVLISNKDRADRMEPATTNTCKVSPPREGKGEAAREMLEAAREMLEAAQGEAVGSPLIAQPAVVTFGQPSFRQLSRSQLLSLLRSDCKASNRKIDMVVLHCSDTRPSQQFTIEKLIACHKARGFGPWPGYHLYVRRDGSLYYCRPVNRVGCHVKGWNAHSIGVCYEGGHSDSPEYKYEDNRTAEQLVVMDEVLRTLLQCYPEAVLKGHNELAAKACPCFDVKTLPIYAGRR